jgi:hypothetical protein
MAKNAGGFPRWRGPGTLWKTSWKGRTFVDQIQFYENFQTSPPAEQFFLSAPGTGLTGLLDTSWWVGLIFRPTLSYSPTTVYTLATCTDPGTGFGWSIQLNFPAPGNIVATVNNGVDPFATLSLPLVPGTFLPNPVLGFSYPVSLTYAIFPGPGFARATLIVDGVGTVATPSPPNPAALSPVWPAPGVRFTTLGGFPGAPSANDVGIAVLQGSNTTSIPTPGMGGYGAVAKANAGLVLTGSQSHRWFAGETPGVQGPITPPIIDPIANLPMTYASIVPPAANLVDVLHGAVWPF